MLSGVSLFPSVSVFSRYFFVCPDGIGRVWKMLSRYWFITKRGWLLVKVVVSLSVLSAGGRWRVVSGEGEHHL